MKQHPFLENSNIIFPSQNLPLSRKTETWKRANMDAAEFEARKQFAEKHKLLENYKIANGELIDSQYSNEPEAPNHDLINQLSQEGGIPDVIKNYSIISQPLATLEGEMDGFPDVFTVKGWGDIFESEKMRVKTDLLKKWFVFYMNQAIEAKLEQSEDPSIFEDEEAYSQAYQQEKEVMFPPEIEKYMNTSYRHILELWGEYELKDQFERFKLKKLRRRDFYHWLRIAQRFRHLYVSSRGLEVESLNPLFTFCKKSPNIEDVQDGHLAGFVQILSVPAFIDRYGDYMTDKEINDLETPYVKPSDADVQKRPDGSKIDYLTPNNVPYQTRVSSFNPEFYSLFPDMMSHSSQMNGMFLSKEELSKIDGSGGAMYGENLIVVTTAYWRSQRRKGKLNWINPETNLQEIIIVDETFDVPDNIKQIKNEKFNVDAGLNTLIWARETEIWQGIKASPYSGNSTMREPMYLEIKPAEIQIGKLLVAGHFANNINTVPTSVVDNSKSWQWFFNVLINQSVLYVQTEILPFALFSSDMIPNDKDWGGEEGLVKWLAIAQSIGANVADTGPSNNGQQNLGGQYPKVVDLDRGSRVLSRINLALQIKQLALEHIGMSPQRMGNVKVSETATGIQQATNASGVQTSHHFTGFFEGEKEMLQMQLDAAKFLQARGKQANNIKAELSTEALRMAMEDGDLYDLHVYVTDSQDELRKLQMARQLAVENNTSEMAMSDRLNLSTSSSIVEIMETLKESERKTIERNQQAMQLEQQKLEQQGMDMQAAREQAQRNIEMQIEKDIQVALIQATGGGVETDANTNGISDIIEYNKTVNANTEIANKNQLAGQEFELARRKHSDEISLAQQKLRNEREARVAELALEKQKLKRDIVRGDKSK